MPTPTLTKAIGISAGARKLKKAKIFKDSFVGGEGHFVEQCVDQLVYLLGIPRIISYSLL